MTNSHLERFPVEAELEWPSLDPGPVPSPPLFDQDQRIADEPVDAPRPLPFDQDQLSERAVRRAARKRHRRRRALIAVMAVITVPLGVGAGVSLSPSDESGGDERPPVAADRPTRPVFDGTIRIPDIAVEPVSALAPLPEQVPATSPTGAPTTSLTAPSPARGGAAPTTSVAAAPPATTGPPAPPPTTAAAPAQNPPADSNPVCPVLPVLCP